MDILKVSFRATLFCQLWYLTSTQFMPQMPHMPMMPQMPMAPQMMGGQMPMGSPPMGPPPMGPPPMPGMMPGMPPPIPLPVPMPMPIPLQSRLPVVVMPFHSKAADKKHDKHNKKKKSKKHKKKDSSDSSDSDDESCDGSTEFRSSNKKYMRSRDKRQRQVLTPIISYVTKSGRVVYQKKIKKDKAKEWLHLGQQSGTDTDSSREEPRAMDIQGSSKEMSLKEFKDKYRRAKKRRRKGH